MAGNEKAMVTKEQSEKHRKILDGLMKLPENRECADCKSKGPRWASVNLGVFLCIQCSGIHRSLGVHISKVRSATLDTWLPEQVDFMQSMGNAKANAYWEAQLLESFRRPSENDRTGLEAFIRAKYEQRRWVRMNDEEHARVKASLRDKDDYGRRDRYDDRSSYDRPRRAYDPDYDKDWSHGAHSNYNKGSYDRKDDRTDRFDRMDRNGYGGGGKDDRDRGGRYDKYGGGDNSRGGGDRDYGDRYRGDRERDEPRGVPCRPETKDHQPNPRPAPTVVANGPASRAPPAARSGQVLTVPLPGPAQAASAAAPVRAASAAVPAPATATPPAGTQAQVNKAADLFDLLAVNDPAPASAAGPAAAAPASAPSSLDAWAHFPDSTQGSTAAPGGAANGFHALGQNVTPASAPASTPMSPPKDKSDILSLFDNTPIAGPFLMAQQQQQQMAAALYAQQQYMVAAAAAGAPGHGANLSGLGSPTKGPPAASLPAGLQVMGGFSMPAQGHSAGAAPVAPGGFPGMNPAGMPMYPTGVAQAMPYGAPGAVPMGMYAQAYSGMPYMGMPYGQQGTMPAPFDAFGMMPNGAAFAASAPGASSTPAASAPSTGASFDFSSLTAAALKK